jgi:hypothetical protein
MYNDRLKAAHLTNMPLSQLEGFQIVDIPETKGRGLFTLTEFQQGEDIYRFDYWSKELMPIHVTNHSCNPNARFNQDGMLVALRDIAKGEEITYDYLIHPIPASPWNFMCQCSSANCLGWINVSNG